MKLLLIMDIFISGGLFSFETIFKAFLVLGSVFYLVFSLLVLKQVNVTNRTVQNNEGGTFKFISILNFGASVAVLLLILGLIFTNA